MIGIRGIAPFLQGTKTMVNSLPEVLQLTDDRLNYLQATGIENVLIDAQYSAYDFAKAASEKVLAENGLSGTDLDLIIMIKSRLPEAVFSSEATRLQKDIGAESAMTYSLSDLGCADMSMALKQASDFLIANEWAEHVLICYGCKPGAPSRYRHPVTVNGDGGLALLVGRLEEHQILDVEIKVDGAYWDLFKIDYQDKYFCDYKEELQDERRYGFELALESRNQFHALNQRILERNDLSKEDIDHFLLQNIYSELSLSY